METILQQKLTTTPSLVVEAKTNLWQRFINWCNDQEKARFGWLGAALATHGCIATPITLFCIILAGNPFVFWIMAIVAMGSALITNLAALPTKITIPVFALSLVIDIAIIISCLSMGLQINAALV